MISDGITRRIISENSNSLITFSETKTDNKYENFVEFLHSNTAVTHPFG